MWQIIAALLYTFIFISNALENKALRERTYERVGEEEFQYVVSLGVFKDGIYIHICMAVMIANLNGITAGKCGHYNHYANEAGLINREKNLPENERTKLHINTKRPIHSLPDTFYPVIDFIDFDKYLLEQCQGENYLEGSDIGVIVLDKEVQFTRPVFNVPISEIHGIDFRANLKLITINTIEEEPSGNKILIKKKIRKMKSHDHANEDAHVKPSQFRVFSYYYYSGINLLKDDLGGPIYWKDQLIGILVESDYALATIHGVYEKHINEIITSTWFSWTKGRQSKSPKASTSRAYHY